MEHVNITFQNIHVTFDNTFSRTRSGFTHTSTVRIPFFGIEKTACVSYVNRTWEAFPFQTSMKRATYSARSTILDTITRRETFRNNWKRISKKRREAVRATANDTPGFTFLGDLINYLDVHAF